MVLAACYALFNRILAIGWRWFVEQIYCTVTMDANNQLAVWALEYFHSLEYMSKSRNLSVQILRREML
jgi:hypothetical protein